MELLLNLILRLSCILFGLFIQLNVSLKPRCAHSMTALCTEVTEVTMFGGAVKYARTLSDEDIISETVLLHFGENTLLLH